MSIFRFKSLTMRIWTTFTAIILIIICSISFFYLLAYKSMDEKARIQDLQVAHDILLNNSNFNQADMFNELKNLQGSRNFTAVVESGKTRINDIGKLHGMPPAFPHEPPKNLFDGLLPEQAPPPGFDSRDVELWIAGHITGNIVDGEVFKETYQNQKYIFIISSVNSGNSGKNYLVSYIPEIQDNRLLYLVIGIGLLFILIGFLTAKIVAGRISKPLGELEDYTARIARKDWKDPIPVKSVDEIGRLADAMNRMQMELKHADEEEKMFLQSISHDLKTPVMVIMSHAAAIMDGVYMGTVEKTAEIIRNEAMRLEKKIKQLLYLNTLDYVMMNRYDTVKINLHDLLRNIVNRFELINSEIEWNLEIEEVMIQGDSDKIQVAIENILDNALRYAESRIDITLKPEHSHAVLEIYNDGPLIHSNSINQIFDNMFRDKSGKFGLGLAISKKIIHFYQGEINAVNREKGVSFIIRYPL